MRGGRGVTHSVQHINHLLQLETVVSCDRPTRDSDRLLNEPLAPHLRVEPLARRIIVRIAVPIVQVRARHPHAHSELAVLPD